MKLSKLEKIALRKLKRLEDTWPESLWLFSAAGQLHVMKCDEDGNQVDTKSGGVDSKYSVGIINIPNSGGDW